MMRLGKLRYSVLIALAVPCKFSTFHTANDILHVGRAALFSVKKTDRAGSPCPLYVCGIRRTYSSMAENAEENKEEEGAALSPSQIQELLKFHSIAMTDTRWKLQESEVFTCIIKSPVCKDGYRSSLYAFLEKFRILNPYKNPLALLRTASNQSRNEVLAAAFLIKPNDFDGSMFFFLLHVWMLHRRMITLGNSSLNSLFWEKVWNSYQQLLILGPVPEGSLSRYLREMQEYSLGFCIGLDQAFNSNSGYWSGLVRYVLWNHIYKPNNVPIDDFHVGELVTYVLRMFQFLKLLPDDAFRTGSFYWPEWVPLEGMSGA